LLGLAWASNDGYYLGCQQGMEMPLSLSLSKSTVSIDKAHEQLEKRRSGDGLNFETGFVSLYQGCTLSGLLAKQADGPAHGGLSLGPSFHIPKKKTKKQIRCWFGDIMHIID